jgi:DNA replication protein DnaC
MSDVPQVLLAHHLKALKLPTFLREYDKLARQCAAEGVAHTRYLLRLSELELLDRERRLIERRIRAARFPAVKSLDSFPAPHGWLRHPVSGRDPQEGDDDDADHGFG